jgi:hypothetical protein
MTEKLGYYKIHQGQCDLYPPNPTFFEGEDHLASTEQHPERSQIDTLTNILVSNSPLDIDPTTSCQAIQAWPAGGMAKATDTAQSDISAPTKKPTCQKCNQENEISSHLILDCEALGQTQHKIFSQYLLLPSLYMDL